ERRAQLSDPRQIFARHGTTIEEVARGVEFDALNRSGPHAGEGRLDLRGKGATRRGAVDRVSPQVAERTGERALRAGEKDRRRPLDDSMRTPLILDQNPVGLPRIDGRLRRPHATKSPGP